jgi:hypothetical protein
MSLVDISGHLAFILTFVSFFQKSMIKLRLWAIVAGVAGLGYNGWVHSMMPAEQGIWPVLFWLSVFLIQNIVLAVIEIRDRMEVKLRPASRELMVSAFPGMHSRDWSALLDIREERYLAIGEKLIGIRGPTDSFMILAAGELDEIRHDGRVFKRKPGTMFGELTFIMGVDEFNSSPCDVICSQGVAVVYSFPYEKLRKLCKSPRLKLAFEEGVVRSAGLKHGLLHGDPVIPAPTLVSA